MKKALITGITGQDGSYLAELLLSKGYEVHGIIRRASTFNTGRIDHIYSDPHEPQTRLFLHYGDLSDSEQTSNIMYNIRPEEVYHLGAQSHVKVSFNMPEYTGNVTALGTARILESIRRSGNTSKFYQASSSEMFGRAPSPQNEETPFSPTSPYAVAKVYAYWNTKNYRLGYGMFACNGILFNHESPVRGETFVTRKITRALTRIHLGLQDRLYLGNLEARRDWGHARDYVEMMWLMLQQPKADDYVIATGEQHTIREFVEVAAQDLGIALAWRGSGIDEKGYDQRGKCVVAVDPRYLRPAEVDSLMGDSTKAHIELGWKPKVTFTELVREMIAADLQGAEQEKLVRTSGFPVYEYHE